MLISAAVRPRGLKRGVSDKKLAQMLGFKEAIGLTDACGRLELSADKPSEFYFLREMYNAFTPRTATKSTKIIIEIDGKTVAQYSYEPQDGQ